MTNSYTSSLTLAKLQRPRVGNRLVPRPHLLERLNASQSLTLVLAPAGYGKTTLLSTWLEAYPLPNAWLSLDERDDDPVAFVSYLVEALHALFPEAANNTLTLANGVTLPSSEILSRNLLNDLSAIQQDFVLVLDDYQFIRQPAIHELMTELVRHLPRTLHLVISSRHDPPLSLAGLRARGHVVELRAADLHFSLEETALLVRNVMALEVDERTIAVLTAKTEGWPVGLRLAALSLRQQRAPGMITADASGDNRYVMDYLMAEVLAQLPISVQEFLIKTSILDQVCGPLCEVVTGMIDRMFNGQYILEWLERADLFLLPVDQQQRWYRYHQLFRQLLRQRLEQLHDQAEIAALHLRASTWFAENGYLDEALHHALAANDGAAAAQIVAQHRHELMNQAQWQRLDRWVKSFPREVVEQQPDLLLAEVSMKFIQQRLREVAPLLDRAEALLPDLPPQIAAHLQGEADSRRSALLYWSGDVTRSLTTVQQALAQIPAAWWYVRGYARLFLSAGEQIAGDLNQAYATLYEPDEPDQGSGYQDLLLGAAGIVHWIAADLSGMAQAARRVVANSDLLDRAEMVVFARHHVGLYHYQRNELAAAEEYLLPLVLRPYLSHALCFLNSAVLLARIRQRQGRPEEAREIVDVMLSFALETRSEVLLSGARAFQAELALRQGRLAEANQWAAQSGSFKPVPLPFAYVPPLTLALILVAQNTPASRQQARQLLTQLHDYFMSIHYTAIIIRVLALQAMLYRAEDDEPQALAALEKSIELAEPGRFLRFFVDLGPQLKPLLIELAQRGVAPTYIAEICAAYSESDMQSLEVVRQEKMLPESVSHHAPILVQELTNREMDVLLLLAQRLTNKEIAQALGISSNTVKQHTLTLFEKLHVHTRREAVAWARAHGLLPAP